MTNEKALEHFTDRLVVIKSREGFGAEYIEATEIAIQAIEKQIPKKPIENIIVRPVIAENGAVDAAYTDIYLLCPACGEQVGFNDSCNNYCRECGQKIDWTEEGK